MRPIDADALLEAMKTDVMGGLNYRRFIEEAPTIEPMEWIPCSERLPHAEYGESDNVLVTCESKYIRLLYFNGGNWCYPTGECYEHRIDKVVAWMPLPKPWKGADNDSGSID